MRQSHTCWLVLAITSAGGSACGSSPATTDAPTSAAPTWTFSGGSASVALTSGTAPAPVTIAAEGDVSAAITLQLAAPTESGSLTLSSAENACCGLTSSDVSPATLPPDDANLQGNPILYLSFENPGATAIGLGGKTPAITLSPTAGGTLATVIAADDECQLDYLVRDGGTPAWTAVPSASVTLAPDATSVAIPTGTLDSFSFGPGQGVGAISCD